MLVFFLFHNIELNVFFRNHYYCSSCDRFRSLTEEKRLWTSTSFTSKELNVFEIISRLRYLTPKTKRLEIRGNCTKDTIETRPIPNKQTFKEIIKRIVNRSPLLEHLSFSNVCFDWSREFAMSKFPANLRELTFLHCIIPKNRSRSPRCFTGIHDALPNLAILNLEFCNFFEANDLMPFSKLPNLTTLSLRGCPKMKSSVPYLSLACRFGFQKLEVFDLRETNISDGELQCLNSVKSLRAIYLEYPEFQPNEDDSDEDEDVFRLLFRAPPQRRNHRVRRPLDGPQVPPPPANAPQPPLLMHNPSLVTDNQPQPSTSSSSRSLSSIASLFASPSTSNQPEQLPSTSTASPAANEDSGGETFSDSISSSSSDEEQPTRTILIRANINPSNNQEQAEPRIQVIINGEMPDQYLSRRNMQRSRYSNSLSDRGILSFGLARTSLIILGGGNNVNVQEREQHTQIERLILRNYNNITDATLTHLEANAPQLSFLDVRGCRQITREAVERFKLARGNCTIITNFDFEE